MAMALSRSLIDHAKALLLGGHSIVKQGAQNLGTSFQEFLLPIDPRRN
jgi:hypothetical protein